MRHLAFIFLFMATFFSAFGQKPPKDFYAKEWAKVDSLQAKGLPRSAADVVNGIYERAKRESQTPQFIKALLFKSKYTTVLTENALNPILSDLKSQLNSGLPIAKPMLHSILGELYWRYYQENRWRFMNRTSTEDLKEEDVATWDLNKILTEAAGQYRASIANPAQIQGTPVGFYNEIVLRQGDPSSRPTLFDFLAHRALGFFTNTEAGLYSPKDKFVVDQADWFKAPADFAHLSLPKEDALGFDALKLYQDLLRFHLKDTEASALVDLEVERLRFMYRNAVLNDKDHLYEQALRGLQDRYGVPMVSEALYARAELYMEQGGRYDPKKGETWKWRFKNALTLCDEIRAKFKNTRAAKNCDWMEGTLRASSATLETLGVAEPSLPFPASVQYRNAKTVYVKAVKLTWAERLRFEEYDDKIEKLIAQKRQAQAEKFISIPLPDDGDLQQHSTEVILPALATGYYLIFIAPDEGFKKVDTTEGYRVLDVSHISFLNREREGENEFFFTHRTTGQPLAGAKVDYYERTNRRYHLVKTLTTDANGYLKIPKRTTHDWAARKIHIAHQGSMISTGLGSGYYYDADVPTVTPVLRTFIFTDRSIYRPTQKIFFKALVMEKVGNNDWRVKPDYKTELTFYNVNGEKVQALNLTTNAFGTVSGEFIAPVGVLTGQMRLSNDHGTAYVSVEEYKRPRFEASFSPLATSPSVGEEVSVKGKAQSYAGANLGGAKVKYRITRGAEMPMWSWWYRWWNPIPPTEIAQGSVETQADGTFEIKFIAEADRTLDPKTEPIFRYTISADVTDITGETHSAETTVAVGYKALQLRAELEELMSKDEFKKLTILATNLNGQDLATTGQITLQRLNTPARSLRKRLWANPELASVSKETWVSQLPKDPYLNENDPTTWAVGETVFNLPFDTGKSKTVSAEPVPSGAYLLTLKAKDPQNREVETKQLVTVFDANSKTLAQAQPEWFVPLKNSGEPGEVATFLIGSTETVRVLFEVEHQKQMVSSEWLTLTNEQRVLRIPIEEKHRGNFGVHVTFIRDNRAYAHTELISVPFSNKQLSLKFETFRNKLYPGQEEEWRIKVAGPKGEKVAAEMVATMYDQSLDAFKGHGWWMSLWDYESPRHGWTPHAESSGSLSFSHKNPAPRYDKTYDALNWYGWTYSGRWYGGGTAQNPSRQTAFVATLTENSITGQVISNLDKKTNPISGAVVRLEGTNKVALTDASGRFSFKGLAAGSYTILVYALGFQTVYDEVSVSDKQGASMLFKLQTGREEEAIEVYAAARPGRGMARAKMSASMQVEDAVSAGAPPAPAMAMEEREMETEAAGNNRLEKKEQETNATATKPKTDLSGVKARTNLNETAFFLPSLLTDAEGNVILSFKMPEALTRWKMMGLAHTKDGKYGQISETTVTQKDLMVTPNAPRFFRENDQISFTAKIDNLAEQDLSGQAQLFLFDAITNAPLDAAFANTQAQQDFTAKKGSSVALSWSLKVPEGYSAVTYRVVAKAGNFTDGEEAPVPVLTDRMLVTESLPLPVRKSGATKFSFEKLLTQKSPSLRHQGLTVEFTPNPIWYAVQAIPYMMEYPYECAEQTFTRFYANQIAQHIVNKQPKIKEIFEKWKTVDKEAFLSNLEKNQELKSALLEETPWVFEAADEQERKKRIALLFDTVRMTTERNTALRKLQDMQLSNGAFPWFKGMPHPDRWITQHIVTGLGQLKQLGVFDAVQDAQTREMLTRALRYLDDQLIEDYKGLQRSKVDMKQNHLGWMQVHYLYARSLFQSIEPNANVKTSFDYYFGQAQQYWLSQGQFAQGMIALGLHRYRDAETPKAIVRSLKERALTHPELGMYWKNDGGFYWYQAPIETQAMMIEVFHEIANDQASVEEMKLWLLKNKQTQDWKTTKATAAAVYALLLRGTDLLAQNQTVTIQVGSTKIDPQTDPNIKSEAGTGYFKTRIEGKNVKPEMGNIVVNKSGNGAAWGAVYWQYFEKLDKITPAATPLKLEKKLFLEKLTPNGPTLTEITPQTLLKPGDRVKVRIIIRVDRAMEYVHLKDMRAAGFEPENVLSGYRYQDGLGYYEATRDAATNFFISWLAPGTYVFEYALKANLKGNFSNGITSIQCMYAPEFASHSEGIRVSIGE